MSKPLTRAVCRGCHREIALREDGSFWFHKRRIRVKPWTARRCPGMSLADPVERVS